VDIGEIIPRKDGTYGLVISVGEPYYMSESDCEQAEDMGSFGQQRGWYTQYQTIQIEEPVAVREAKATRDAEVAAYHAALAPAADYRKRHGATLGGVITMSGAEGTESFSEPRMAPTGAGVEWEQIAQLTEGKIIGGRPMSIGTIYRAMLPDGRPIFRQDDDDSYGDSLRTTYYLPADVWEVAIRAEIAANHVTPEAAREWLTKYRGCVGTEMYEVAAEMPQLTE